MSGAPDRNESKLNPLNVQAGRPRKSTKIPSPRRQFWSIQNATWPPLRRWPSMGLKESLMSNTLSPFERRRSLTYRSTYGFLMGRTITPTFIVGYRSVWQATHSQQAKWPLNPMTPFPPRMASA